MDQNVTDIQSVLDQIEKAKIYVQTLGNFGVTIDGNRVDAKQFGRDASLQLFQFLITSRDRQGLHKEQIIDRIWYNLDGKAGLQNFKVAHHGANKALEPNRAKGQEPSYILRNGSLYHLDLKFIAIDIDIIESLIVIGNQNFHQNQSLAIEAYTRAIELDKGIYMTNRLYEDWSSEERERIQLIILNAYMSLGELQLSTLPAEAIRLAQRAIQIDNTWEEAYRLQMRAYQINGNRPMVIKTYKACEAILETEFGIDPLPETRKILNESIAK